MPLPILPRAARRLALACLFAQGLTACAPAPVALPPVARVPDSFREPVDRTTAAAPSAAGWWQVFDDAPLDAWMRRALLGNPGLQQAAARVARAAAAWDFSGAQARPQVAVNVGATRQVGPLVNAAGDQGNLFSADARLRYDVDLFQKLSRGQQAAWHDLQAERALQRQARLLLQADVAQAYLAWRAVQGEQRTLQSAVEAGRALLTITDRRVRAGLVAPSVRSTAQAELLTDEADLQALDRRKALLAHALVALAGGDDDAPPAPAPDALPALPAIPPGLPSRMLQRRPDVAAAEQAMQAARLRLGLARDAWFPDLALTANAGFASSELGQWLRMSARNAGLGLLLSLPGLDGGRGDAVRAQAAATLQLATAEHREKVLLALREVDDQLATLRTLAAEAAARRAVAEDAAREAERIAGQSQRGLAGEGEVLLARRHAHRQQRLLAQTEGLQRQAAVALVRALGGGWGDETDGADGADGSTPPAAQRTASN